MIFISKFFAFSIYLFTYSGPVSDIPVSSITNPLCIHWGRIPPIQLFLSIIITFLAPDSFADIPAANPAGPPPITVTSLILFIKFFSPSFANE